MLNRAPIICLLPVRNGGPQLRNWLDEASAFADHVIALDDGSIDETSEVLHSHPIVTHLLANPPRDGFVGWHDGRNRNRLLAAAAALAPAWVVSVDVDERLDPDEAEALRRFVSTEALTPCAYGFQVYRMINDEVCDPAYRWAFRLFWFTGEQCFPNRRFDFAPVPTTITRERWVGTTIRIKNFGEVDEANRKRQVLKYREADPEGLFRDYYENLELLSAGPFAHWEQRDALTPLLYAAPLPASPSIDAGRPSVVCLLPARDCAELLPGWFESVARFADAVVALDDGSIDDTGAILRAHPLVARVLTNPVRTGFAGWDDGANRNRLLAGAAELNPDWIISVDADERVPLEDGVALRRFLREEAEPGYGYGFRSYRMIGDEEHYDRPDYDAYRLFAFEPHHVFPTNRLHAPPIPSAIPREDWRLTTIRMKHLVALTEDHRRARFEKYREADSDRLWEPDYSYTIDPPGDVNPWPIRVADQPFLFVWGAQDAASAALDLDGPVLTVVCFVESGGERAAGERLAKLTAANDDVEILALTRDPYTADVLRRVAGLTTVTADPKLSTAALCNRALGVARGDYVLFVDANDPINTSDIAAIVDAHDAGNAVVGVPVVTPTESTPGIAEFLLTRCPLNGGDGAARYVSFSKLALHTIGGFDEELEHGFEGVAARVLIELGLTAMVIATAPHPHIVDGGIVGFIRRQYNLGRALSRSRATLGDTDASDVPSPTPPSLPAGVSRQTKRLVVIGAAATRYGAVREQRRIRGH